MLAPLEPLHAQHAEMVRAMALGVANGTRRRGGWRLDHRPPDAEAADANGRTSGRINARDPSERLAAPPTDDELGQLARLVQRPAGSPRVRLAPAASVHGRCLARIADAGLGGAHCCAGDAGQGDALRQRNTESHWSSSASRRTGCLAWSTRCSCCRAPRLRAFRSARSF